MSDLNLAKGSLGKSIFWFSLQLSLTSILQQVFTSADIYVVGAYVGTAALAAVGANAPVINLLINLFVGLSIGSNAVISRFLGEGNLKNVRRAVHSSVALSLVCGTGLSIFGLVFAKDMLEWCSTPFDIIDDAAIYLKIFFAGMPFLILYNFLAAIFRASGDTKKPLIALSISGVINVLLNIFFIVVCHMEVAGVALATVIANGISVAILWYYLTHKRNSLRLYPKKISFNLGIIKKISSIGLPAGIQGLVFSLSNIIIQIAINDLGTNAVAASTISLNYEFLAYFMLNAFGLAAVTFVGQNYGARLIDRCKTAVKWCLLQGVIVTAILTFISCYYAEFLSWVFTDNKEVIELTIIRIRLIIGFEILNIMLEVFSGALRGYGKSLAPAISCVFGICVFRIIWVYTIFANDKTFTCLMTVYPISWLITISIVGFIYFKVQRQLSLKLQGVSKQ